MISAFGHAALRRMLIGYLTDLFVSIGVLLVGSRLWGLYLPTQAMPTLLHRLVDAIQPLTPPSLWQSYNDALSLTLASIPHDVGGGPAANALVVLQMVWVAIAAVPDTLLGIYLQGDPLQEIVCGLGVLLAAAIFTRLAFACRGRGWRLVLVALATIPLTSLTFGLLQWGVFVAAGTRAMLAATAPWWLACPILCTLWWVIVPGASRGAVATLVHAMGRSPGDRPTRDRPTRDRPTRDRPTPREIRSRLL